MPMLAVTDDVLLADEVRRPELADEPLGHGDRPLQVWPVGGRGRELVAAEAGDEVAVAHGVGDPLGDRDEECVAGGVAERVVDDLEVVEVDEEDGRHRLAAAAAARARSRTRSRRQLEHPAVGRAGQRVALGEVLDVAQEHRVAQVQRGDRAELAEHRRDPAFDTPSDRPRPVLDDDRAERPGRPRRIGETSTLRASGRSEVRSGLRAGSSRLTGSRSLRRPGAGHDRVRVGRRRSGRRRRRGRQGRPSGRPTRRGRRRAAKLEAVDESVEDDLRLAGPDRSRRRASSAELDQRLADRLRRWRSSRSFIAEKTDVASANSQNEVTLRTGIRSNSIARPGIDVDRRHERGGLRVEDDEQQQRMPQRDLQAGPVRGQQRDGDEVEVDRGSGSGSACRRSRTSPRRGRRRRRAASAR